MDRPMTPVPIPERTPWTIQDEIDLHEVMSRHHTESAVFIARTCHIFGILDHHTGYAIRNRVNVKRMEGYE